jgi:hypothetical protein
MRYRISCQSGPQTDAHSISVPQCAGIFRTGSVWAQSVGSLGRKTPARRTQPRRDDPSGPLGRGPGMDRVVDEHEPHRPVPRSRLGKLVPGPEEPRQRDGGGSEPDDHPNGQEPRRGTRRHHDDARDRDSQPDVPRSEGLDGHPPVSVVPQLRRLVHVRDCSTPAPPRPARGDIQPGVRSNDVFTSLKPSQVPS